MRGVTVAKEAQFDLKTRMYYSLCQSIQVFYKRCFRKVCLYDRTHTNTLKLKAVANRDPSV
jgi:hypothetical protein